MRRRAALAALAAIPGLVPLSAAAQSSARIPRIGVLYLMPTQAEIPGGFELGMRELGYVEGRNVVYERRDAAGLPERLPGIAAELVKSGVDVILAGGPGPTAAARQATNRVPIVTVGGSDPVAEGWARTLARPGGNVTGLTVTYPGIAAKRLELAKEAMPQLARVALLMNPAEWPRRWVGEQLEEPSRRLGMHIEVLEVHEAADLEHVFEVARRERVQAILTIETPLIASNRKALGALALRERMPLISEFTSFGEDGMLIAYGASISDLLRRAASHVDRILKGTPPGDLPIERPTQLDLTINLKTARALGITVPKALLLRADRVIE
jgi:putative ABC transport system substrate-binding protein